MNRIELRLNLSDLSNLVGGKLIDFLLLTYGAFRNAGRGIYALITPLSEYINNAIQEISGMRKSIIVASSEGKQRIRTEHIMIPGL